MPKPTNSPLAVNRWQIALRSLFFYWRTNLSVACGVAAATAVLTGALIVGDSMRSSLRQLTIERLGQIDELLVSDGFFSAQLSEQIAQTAAFKTHYTSAQPAILFPGGTVEANFESAGIRRANRVTVLGITEEFWSFGDPTIKPARELSGMTAMVNQALADELQITAPQIAAGNAKLTVRIPKQNQLPGDSAMSKQDDLIESLVELEILEIIPNSSLGRFDLHPTQADPLNVYLPIALLQDSLSRTVLKHKTDPAQANIVLLSGQRDSIPTPDASEELSRQIRPTLEDYGLSLKRVTRTFSAKDSEKLVFDYWSLSADRMVLTDPAADRIQSAFPTAKPVFTYLANDIRLANQPPGIPFSMVASIDFDDSFQPISRAENRPIGSLRENEIVLNEWAAEDLAAKVGDTVVVTYFEPETTHGSQVERQVQLQLVDIAKLTQPSEGYVVPRRGPIQVAKFSQAPQISNDPDLTPEVPGVTDAESIEKWDLPFETASRIRPQDDQYWEDHRTTPKAFVSLATGQKLWQSRFGQTTSFRIPASVGDADLIESQLLVQIADHSAEFGLHLVPIKRRGLAASAGSTPFDVLFLALSMFVIGSALILVSLLFRLGFQQRAAEVGLMCATGFPLPMIRRLWLIEVSLVSLAGATLGILVGIGYAALMIWGLSTWWVGAISRPFLHLNLTPSTMLIGLISGALVCVATILWSLRSAVRQNIRNLLAGQIDSSTKVSLRANQSRPWLIAVLALAAIGLTWLATKLAGEAQAGSFMGAGFLVLTASLMSVHRWLRSKLSVLTATNSSSVNFESTRLGLTSLAILNARRNPLRSTLTIGLVAVASFLIAAVSAFRLTPTEQGTAGFDWVAQSSQPILVDLATTTGQAKILGDGNKLTPGTIVLPVRYKSGEDASCNNLYQSTQPQVLGLPISFVEYFQPSATTSNGATPSSADDRGAPTFAWAGHLGQTMKERVNPWQLLAGTVTHAGTATDPIPAVIDKNTANYSLKIYFLDTIFAVKYDTGEAVHFRIVGFLSNTILQGSLIIGEQDFVQAFPALGGYQYFLIKDGPANPPALAASSVERLEDRLSDYGFDARSAPQLLANFMTVQNTYLSTFQTLGALGLILGTFGLAAVQLRGVLERKKELGLLRAVGFSQQRLGRLVLLENGFLLLTGLGVGIGAALFTTLPHWLMGNAAVPWSELAAMFAAILIVGLMASFFASRQIFKLPLLESLRT